LKNKNNGKTLPTVIVGRVYIIDVVMIIEKYMFHRTDSREGFVVSLDVIDKTQYYVGL
jgi:hypothetical protein